MNNTVLNDVNARDIAVRFNTISVADMMIEKAIDKSDMDMHALWKKERVTAAQHLISMYGIYPVGYEAYL